MGPSRFFAACLAVAVSATPAAADFTLTILHTHDIHSRIKPINKYDSGCSAKADAAGKCFVGSATLVHPSPHDQRAAGKSVT